MHSAEFLFNHKNCVRVSLLRCTVTPILIYFILAKRKNFSDFHFAFKEAEALEKWGLLLFERINFVEKRGKMKVAELLLLKVYLSTLSLWYDLKG